MKHRRIRGATLMEAVISAGIGTLVLTASMSIFMFGMNSWYRGQGRIVAEGSANQAMRAAATEVREALSLTVDSDGLGITYQLPSKNTDGSYVVPMTTDGVSRRIALVSGSLLMTSTGVSRTLVRNVLTTDPTTTSTYRVFTPSGGLVVRQLTILLVTKSSTVKTETYTNRSMETIYLRNVPELYQ